MWVRKEGYESERVKLEFTDPDKPGFTLRNRTFYFEMMESGDMNNNSTKTITSN
jgi:hypothetical protein